MRTQSKSLIIMILAVALIALGGCESTEEARTFWTDRVAQLEASSAQLDDAIVTIQETINENEAAIGSIPEEGIGESIRDAIAASEFALADLLERKGSIDSSLQNAQAALDGISDDASAIEINAVGVGESAKVIGSAVPQPYGGIIALVGGLIGAAGAAWGRRKAKDAHDAEETTAVVIHSLEVAKRASESFRNEFDQSGSVIRMAQGHKIAPKVDQIRGKSAA